MKITVLVTAAPETPSARLAIESVRRALDSGHSVYLYLYDQSVLLADRPDTTRLGVPTYACFESCRMRSVEVRSPTVVLCGLVTLAGLITASDRLEAFT